MFRQTLRSVARASNLAARRTYADVAATDSLTLAFALPHESLFAGVVQQVNIPSVNGDLGILANHIPIVEQLRPGLLEIIGTDGASKQYFVSGGFATVQPGSKLSITAIEAYEAADFSPESIKSQLAEATKNVSSTDEAISTEAQIQVEVLEALQQITK